MKEINSYIISIFSTIVFLIIGSTLWYRLHLNYQSVQETLANLSEVYIDENIVLKDLKQVSDQRASNLQSYRLVLRNNDDISKKVSIKLVNDYYNKYNFDYKIDNNYLHYMIKKDNGSYSTIRSLNMDGEIYFDNLEANTESVYELKIWVSDRYQDEFDYYGNVIVVYL